MHVFVEEDEIPNGTVEPSQATAEKILQGRRTTRQQAYFASQGLSISLAQELVSDRKPHVPGVFSQA